ncbi:MAG: hypothetical protein GXN96_02075 [Aquificae bacterium]|nr:hypothetical protein [Aquificota bacterium]
MNGQMIRINLNRKEATLKKLLRFDLTGLKESFVNNLLAVAFLLGVLGLVGTGAYYFLLQGTVDNLRGEVEKEKRKREKLLAELRELRREIQRLKIKKKLHEGVRNYNDRLLLVLDREMKYRGVVLQNFSACLFREKDCNLEEFLKRGKIELGEPIVQLDLVFMKDEAINLFPDRGILSQTYVPVGGLPLKRMCIELYPSRELARR